MLVLFSAGTARADAGFGGDFTTGQGYRGFDVKGDADLGSIFPASLNAYYSHVHSTVGTETKSNQIVLGFDHTADDGWDFRGSLTGWKDDISDVKYVGPSFGFDYTIFDGESGGREPSDQRLIVTYNSDFFFYQTGVNASSTTITTGRGKTAKKTVVPPLNDAVNLFQFHPTLELDAPLFENKATPFVQIGRSFYSKNPGLIEERAGDPYFATSANSLNALAGGLFSDDGSIGVNLRLPGEVRLRATLGVEQSATDQSWATTQGVAVSRVFFDLFRAKAAWNRTIQGGIPQDLVTAGGSFLF
jgi:hypothetical protein